MIKEVGMKKYLEQIYKIFDPAYFEVYKFYNASNLRYLFAIKRKDTEGVPLDPWYTIDKKSMKISGFAPHNDLVFFNEAIKHPIDI